MLPLALKKNKYYMLPLALKKNLIGTLKCSILCHVLINKYHTSHLIKTHFFPLKNVPQNHFVP